MRLIFIAITLTLLSPSAFAQGALPEPLTALLSAAHDSQSEDDFSDAVRVIALTRDPADVAAAAAAISSERGAQARAILGLPARDVIAGAMADPVTGPVADAGAAEAARAETEAASLAERAAAAPLAVARNIASGESELWEGRAELGVRFDSGNSDRQDYMVGLGGARAGPLGL
ncbi:MAG: hypothetical protein RIA71_06545 [Oceanicaulis sp.]